MDNIVQYFRLVLALPVSEREPPPDSTPPSDDENLSLWRSTHQLPLTSVVLAGVAV